MRAEDLVGTAALSWLSCTTLFPFKAHQPLLLRCDLTERFVAWGDPRRGGDLSDVQADLHGIQRLQASARSFAALRADGSVVVWPYAGRGFHSALVDSTACSFRKEVSTR